jgi:hypothetical protein
MEISVIKEECRIALKDARDDNHFYKLRWKLKYYFKCKVTNSSEERENKD